MRWTLDRAIWVWPTARALHCVLRQDTTHSHCLSLFIQGYKWYLRIYCWGQPCDGLAYASHPGGVEILLVASCYWNRDKLRHWWATWLERRLYLALSTLMALVPKGWVENTGPWSMDYLLTPFHGLPYGLLHGLPYGPLGGLPCGLPYSSSRKNKFGWLFRVVWRVVHGVVHRLALGGGDQWVVHGPGSAFSTHP